MILSFAHLKKKPAQAHAPLQDSPAPTQEQRAGPRVMLRRRMGIGIMKTALLASANYCRECPRFWPADDQDKKHGIPYGRCCWEVKNETEAWRNIPLTATVARCWWHQQREMDDNTYGPHPDTTIGREWSINLRSEQREGKSQDEDN